MNATKATAALLALLAAGALSASAQNKLAPLLELPGELGREPKEGLAKAPELGVLRYKAEWAITHGSGDRLPAQRNLHNGDLFAYVAARATVAEARFEELTGETVSLSRTDWEKLTQGLVKLERQNSHREALAAAAAKAAAPARPAGDPDPRAQQRREADEWWAAEMQRQATKKQIEDTVRQELDNRRRLGR